jgi:hypothetical protein
VKLRVDHVLLLCHKCYYEGRSCTLDWYLKDGSERAVSYAYMRRQLSKGPNGWRVTYTCKCGATPVLRLARLLPLVPVAHRAGKSILTSYEIC